jgi:hypothetical protein
MKRIHKPACPAANDAVRHTGIMNRYGFVCLFAAFFSNNRRTICRPKDTAGRRGIRGTLIHNENRSQSLAIGFLSVLLVKSSFESLSVTKVCRAPLFPARLAAAMVTAILLTPIAAATDPKYRPALEPTANPLTQNIFSGVSHSHQKARLDNGCRSCQLNERLNRHPLTREDLPNGPRSPITIGVSPARLSARDYTMMMTNVTPSAWMMLRFIPAGV